MVERYSRPQMANNWTMEAKYQAWLDVDWQLSKLGIIGFNS